MRGCARGLRSPLAEAELSRRGTAKKIDFKTYAPSTRQSATNGAVKGQVRRASARIRPGFRTLDVRIGRQIAYMGRSAARQLRSRLSMSCSLRWHQPCSRA